MFDFRSSKNRTFDRLLEVSYDVEKIDYTNASGQSASWYRVTRNARLGYRYVDLSKGGAADVAKQLKTLYTRTTAALAARGASETAPQVITYAERLTCVEIQRESRLTYAVVVDVVEKDVRASATNPASPASLFTAENARDYDSFTINDTISITGAVA